jgi:hypothetical protein
MQNQNRFALLILPLLAAIALFASPALATTNPAPTATVADCHQAIDGARNDLAGVVITGNSPDQTRSSLDSKLDGADLKLDQGKLTDALTKLTDFGSKVTTLQSAGKISDGTVSVAQLLADTDAAAACVQSLIAP